MLQTSNSGLFISYLVTEKYLHYFTIYLARFSVFGLYVLSIIADVE